MPEPHDVFISFHHGDVEAVNQLAAALKTRGVSYSCSDGGTDIGLPPDLPTSEILLAWCSAEYFRSRACQRQLAAAFIACRRDFGADAKRILLINAEAGVKHIYPVHFRELLFSAAPGRPGAPSFPALAQKLQAHCSKLVGILGEECSLTAPGWREASDNLGNPAPRFEGRERELWDVHSILNPPVLPGGETGPVAVVSGGAGQGKSALAREYAFRFGPAYPGGVFRLTAGAAKPAVSLAELAENPPLKWQLSALLRPLFPKFNPAGLTVPALSAHLGEALAKAGQPFLWIVDDLPDGLNGPAFRQWLAPAAPWGRTLVLTRSRGYDQRAEPLHLSPLDQVSALRLLTGEMPPASDSERQAAAALVEDLSRHALPLALAGALASLNRNHRRRRYAALWRQTNDHGWAAEIGARLAGELPKGREAGIAALVLYAIHAADESVRDLLRLAADLAEAVLPGDFIAECFQRSGLSREAKKNRPFAIFLHESPIETMDADTARAHAEAGMAGLERLSLAERTEGGVRVLPLIARAMRWADPEPRRREALLQGALKALYGVAERCVPGRDWERLAPLAPHARMLVKDLQNRSVDAAEDPLETTRRVRLAIILADMDSAQGSWRQALNAYRSIGAYLLRAMTLEPENGRRQRDFAGVQERIGDLLASRGDVPGALDCLRKSLGVRALFAKQDPDGAEQQRDLLRQHIKIGDLLQKGDTGGALCSYRAAHAIVAHLAAKAPSNDERRFELAASHERLALLHLHRDEEGEAWNALRAALGLYQELAEKYPTRPNYARAAAAIHIRIGDFLQKHAALAEALDHYRQARDSIEKVAAIESGDPEWRRKLALCHNHIGNVLTALEDYPGAAEHYRAYLAIAEPLAATHPADGVGPRDMATAYIRLGMAAEWTPDEAGALAHYRTARALLEKLAGCAQDVDTLRKDLAWLAERSERFGEPQAEAS